MSSCANQSESLGSCLRRPRTGPRHTTRTMRSSNHNHNERRNGNTYRPLTSQQFDYYQRVRTTSQALATPNHDPRRAVYTSSLEKLVQALNASHTRLQLERRPTTNRISENTNGTTHHDQHDRTVASHTSQIPIMGLCSTTPTKRV